MAVIFSDDFNAGIAAWNSTYNDGTAAGGCAGTTAFVVGDTDEDTFGEVGYVFPAPIPSAGALRGSLAIRQTGDGFVTALWGVWDYPDSDGFYLNAGIDSLVAGENRFTIDLADASGPSHTLTTAYGTVPLDDAWHGFQFTWALDGTTAHLTLTIDNVTIGDWTVATTYTASQWTFVSINALNDGDLVGARWDNVFIEDTADIVDWPACAPITALTITCGDDQIADSALGAPVVVTWDAPETSGGTGAITVVCVPASGSLFPLGETTVTCTATDEADVTATCEFTVTIYRTLAITCVSRAVDSPTNEAVIVTWPAPATVGGVGAVTTVCVPASGSSFAVGLTDVTCTATDSLGHTATCLGHVTVNGECDASDAFEFPDPCALTTPLYYATLTVGADVYAHSLGIPIDDRTGWHLGYKEPRLLSIGSITKAASDVLTGHFEGQSVTLTYADADRVMRSIPREAHDQPRSTLTNCPVMIYQVGGRNETPRPLFSGEIYNTPVAAHRQFQIVVNDLLGSKGSLFGQEQQVPARLIDAADFPGAPGASRTLAVPIIYGVVSDEAAATPQGEVRLIDVGDLTVLGTTYRAGLLCGHGVKAILNLYQEHPLHDISDLTRSGSTATATCVRHGFATDDLVTISGTHEGAYNGEHQITVVDADTFEYEVEGTPDTPATTEDAITAKGPKDSEIIPIGDYGDTVFAPGFLGYPTGLPYLELNDHWYTVVLLSGRRATDFAEGGHAIYANVQGIATGADGSGDLITDLLLQYRHLLLNWILTPFTSGTWAVSPTFAVYPDGTPLCRVRTQSFQVASETAATLVDGGLVGGFVLGAEGRSQSVRDVIAAANFNCNVRLASNDFGQLFVRMLPRVRTVALAGHTTVEDVTDILDTPAFQSDQKIEWLATELSYRHTYNYRNRQWDGGNALGNAPAELVIGRPVVKKFEFTWIRDVATADAVAQQYLDLLSETNEIVQWARPVCGLEHELLDVVPLHHFSGRAVDQTVWILRKTIDPMTDIVSFEGISIGHLLSD